MQSNLPKVKKKDDNQKDLSLRKSPQISINVLFLYFSMVQGHRRHIINFIYFWRVHLLYLPPRWFKLRQNTISFKMEMWCCFRNRETCDSPIIIFSPIWRKFEKNKLTNKNWWLESLKPGFILSFLWYLLPKEHYLN